MLKNNVAAENYIAMPLLASGRKKRWSYSSLFFSLFFFVPILLSLPLPLSTLATQLLCYGLFVTLYIRAINQPLHVLPYYLSALLILGYATSFQNPGGAIIFGFVGFIIGYYYNLKKGVVFIAGIATSLALLQYLVFKGEGFYLLAATINSIVLFGFGAMERKETLYQLKETKHAESMSVLSAIAERERIGRDLHDVAGHALSSIALKAQLADKLLSKNQVKLAQQEVKALAQLSQALLSDIRHAVSNIKHLSLQQEVAKNVALLEENHFNVAFSMSNNVETLLTSAQETQLALILKELTTNTLRHSLGPHITLDISCRDKNVMLRYCDFGADSVSNSNDDARNARSQVNAKKLNEGNGLTGIRERTELISASVKFQCDSNAAFSCEVSLPIT